MRSIGKLRLLLAAVAGVLALAALAPGASADWDTDHDEVCENADSIFGRGASFQRAAQLAWGAEIVEVNTGGPLAQGFGYEVAGCEAFEIPGDGGTEGIDYAPTGSGSGRSAVGATDTGGPRPVEAVDFAGTDEAPTATQVANANEGDVNTNTDDAILHTIPVAQGSIPIAVRIPNGCQVAFTSDDRRLSRAAAEGAFGADADFNTWGELFTQGGGIVASSGSGMTDQQCRDKQFVRVVRRDVSGTTFQLKRYFQEAATLESSGRDWREPSQGGTLPNDEWPDNGTTVEGTANGNGPLLDRLSTETTNGGIGYADLATARSKGYSWIDGDDTDRTFWVYLEQNDEDDEYQGPALDDVANPTTPGSNCGNVTYDDASQMGTQLPANTEASWFHVDAVNTTVQYPICAITYAMAFENACPDDSTQDRARTVFDYLGYVTSSTGGQDELADSDYQSLPSNVRSLAATGAAELVWSAC